MKTSNIITFCLFALLPVIGMAASKKMPKDSLSLPVVSVTVQDSVPPLEVDTNYIKRFKTPNEYDLLGIDYGVSLSMYSFVPTKDQDMRVIPCNIGILYTHFCKLFGYMPYFAFQGGFYYAQDGYQFTVDDEGYYSHIQNAYKATMQVLELPILALFHYDFWKMRLQASIGVFGGYRMTIHREYLEGVTQAEKIYENSFAPEEYRWDYGLKGGAGFAFILDPIELHLNVSLKYSWMNLYHPDYASKYYYKWAYPINIIVSFGVHYQLTKRVGRTNRELKMQARSEVEQMEKEALAAVHARDSIAAASAAAQAVRDSIAAASAAAQAVRDSIAAASAAAQAVRDSIAAASTEVPDAEEATSSDSAVPTEVNGPTAVEPSAAEDPKTEPLTLPNSTSGKRSATAKENKLQFDIAPQKQQRVL